MNETRDIEQYLDGTMDPAVKLVMEAKMLLNPDIMENITWQKNTLVLIKAYGRKQLRAEIATIEKTLFSEKQFSSFKRSILNIFKK